MFVGRSAEERELAREEGGLHYGRRHRSHVGDDSSQQLQRARQLVNDFFARNPKTKYGKIITQAVYGDIEKLLKADPIAGKAADTSKLLDAAVASLGLKFD